MLNHFTSKANHKDDAITAHRVESMRVRAGCPYVLWYLWVFVIFGLQNTLIQNLSPSSTRDFEGLSITIRHTVRERIIIKEKKWTPEAGIEELEQEEVHSTVAAPKEVFPEAAYQRILTLN